MPRRLRSDPHYDQRKYTDSCHEPCVYFVREGDDGPIKIGHTNNIRARLGNMRASNYRRLSLLVMVPGTRSDERLLHKRFAAHRIGGEWFEPVPELLSCIERLMGLQADIDHPARKPGPRPKAR